MNILLLSAYDANSHKHWYQFLKRKMPQHQWHIFTLPPRFFSWRMRGNSLTWAFDASLKESIPDFDCLVATSMTDLSSLRGMCPSLARLPTLLYFHENQFAYPSSDKQRKSIEPQMVQLYSAICADILVFNSDYNQDTFLAGVGTLLKKLPDGVPKGLVAVLKEKSQTISVPISSASRRADPVGSGACINIVWNHRWEYDKGPDLLEDLVRRLPSSLPVRFHIVGQQFRSVPTAFSRIRSLLLAREWLGCWGFLDAQDYEQLLSDSDIVLSTAKHDFQGLSVLQAVAFGCIPVVPDDLVYPEWFDSQYRYSLKGSEVDNLSVHLERLVGRLYSGFRLEGPKLEPFFWPQLEGKYTEVIADLVKMNNSEKFKKGP